MKLASVTIRNFQSFGPAPERIALDDMTFLLGPNGSGKTAALHALARMFAVDKTLRYVRPSDFHVPAPTGIAETDMSIEAEFVLPEAGDAGDPAPAVPEFLTQMRLEAVGGPMTVRIRLAASLDDGGEVTETLSFVLALDAEGKPVKTASVDTISRQRIQLHYLPARRNPREQISYASTSMLGNALRSANWQSETQTISEWNSKVTEALATNAAIGAVTTHLSEAWGGLHTGPGLSAPKVGFGSNDLDFLLRQLTVNFAPGPHGTPVSFEQLSDGQQSLLYVSTVVALHRIGREAVEEKSVTFDIEKLRPAVFTMFAVEEPENSLSPFYLGRIFRLLEATTAGNDCQAVIATHSPAVLKRVDPLRIRYLRLNADRATSVAEVTLPPKGDDARKYIRQAVQAYPELYFARLVVLGEGPSEEVFLPRLFSAHGAAVDEHSIAVVPLGGRHTNHMWRLLNDLGIPHITLLDLDSCRYGGGWGRVRTAVKNLQQYSANQEVRERLKDTVPAQLPAWDAESRPDENGWLGFLEEADVYFSAPLDLDLLLLEHYPDAYPDDSDAVPGDTTGSAATEADDQEASMLIRSHVLGKKGTAPTIGFTADQVALFERYHSLFQLGSKPSSHLVALANLTDKDLVDDLPPVMERLVVRAATLLEQNPE